MEIFQRILYLVPASVLVQNQNNTRSSKASSRLRDMQPYTHGTQPRLKPAGVESAESPLRTGPPRRPVCSDFLLQSSKTENAEPSVITPGSLLQ